MGAWLLVLYTAGSATPVPLGNYKTEASCYEAIVSFKFDYAEKHGFSGMPDLSCIRVKR